MNFQEFKRLIQFHPDQLADRNSYTGLQKLSMKLAEESPNSYDVDNIKSFLTELVSGDVLNELNAHQIAGLLNFVNDAAIYIAPTDVFLKKLKRFIATNFKSKEDILRRAYLLKLITIINPNEYSPEILEISEGRIIEKYPWFYADVVAQSGNLDYLNGYVLQLYMRSSVKEKTFAEMMKHMEIWWRNRLLGINSQTEEFIKQLRKDLISIKICSEYLDYLSQWAFDNGLLRTEHVITEKVNLYKSRLSASINKVSNKLLLATT